MLEVKNVGFEVAEEDGRKKKILRDVSLTIENGEFVAITGPNGGGKTMLAKVIMGIERASSGEIWLGGEDVTSLGVDERAKKGIGFAFQQPIRFKGFLVRELLSLAAGRRLSSTDACDYLSTVGLYAEEYVDREFDSSLSGGEAKRTEIAMLLARDAKLLTFDEPEAGIDLWSFQNLVDIFERLKKSGKTILVISHQERILKIADRVVLVERGRIK